MILQILLGVLFLTGILLLYLIKNKIEFDYDQKVIEEAIAFASHQLSENEEMSVRTLVIYATTYYEVMRGKSLLRNKRIQKRIELHIKELLFELNKEKTPSVF